MRRGDRDADSVASGDSKRELWGMGRGVTPIGEAASGRNARGDAVSESAASASSTGSWMRKGTRRSTRLPPSTPFALTRGAKGSPAPRSVSRIALGRHNRPFGRGPIERELLFSFFLFQSVVRGDAPRGKDRPHRPRLTRLLTRTSRHRLTHQKQKRVWVQTEKRRRPKRDDERRPRVSETRAARVDDSPRRGGGGGFGFRDSRKRETGARAETRRAGEAQATVIGDRGGVETARRS